MGRTKGTRAHYPKRTPGPIDTLGGPRVERTNAILTKPLIISLLLALIDLTRAINSITKLTIPNIIILLLISRIPSNRLYNRYIRYRLPKN
ncbi:hypothetical protein MGYG_07301 [Nannizzia gypsea CBS 118893]|uniref:Uncharacterized protein n=1 Tax=Arthroderma gypseum (strain ATCC MYA-4604 / CBS 118893) TaxID=535722 RepID=E4V2S0_ARTGP|nr:hypothetical protein MGYG_07301 [Nannizzia gypsea CBS 118893]EFR04294.1 hypothetical protein MGYG_07301 [Nannizzia gypsea CBS 118893]